MEEVITDLDSFRSSLVNSDSFGIFNLSEEVDDTEFNGVEYVETITVDVNSGGSQRLELLGDQRDL